MRLPSSVRAGITYLILWVPALLISAFISYIAGYVGSGFAPLWIAIPFLMVLPAVLLGIFSLRASAVIIVVLLLWDVVVTTWPHISLAGFMSSVIDVLLLITTVLVILTAFFSPFTSVFRFIQHLRDSE